MTGSGAGPPVSTPGQCGPGPADFGLPGDQGRRWRPGFLGVGAAAAPGLGSGIAGRGLGVGPGGCSIQLVGGYSKKIENDDLMLD